MIFSTETLDHCHPVHIQRPAASSHCGFTTTRESLAKLSWVPETDGTQSPRQAKKLDFQSTFSFFLPPPHLKVSLPTEQRLSAQHLREDAAHAPDVDRVPVLRGKHDLRRSVPPGDHVLRKLRRFLFVRRANPPGEPEVAQLEVAVLRRGGGEE